MTRSYTATLYASWSTQQRDGGNTTWGAADPHLTVGVSDGWTEYWQAFIRFGGLPAAARITSATLYLRVTSGIHQSRVGTYPTISLGAPTSDYPTNGGQHSSCGGAGLNINNTAYSWETYGNVTLGGNGQGSTQTIDVRQYIHRIAAASCSVDGFGAGRAQPDWGLALWAVNPSNRTEFWSAVDATRKPYIVVGYELANEAPSPPTVTSLTNGGTYVLANRYTALSAGGDADGDPVTAYELQWGETTANNVAPGAWNTVSASSYTIPSGSLTRGKWYGVRGRNMDHHGAWSGYSGITYFYVNRLPNNPVIA